MLYSLNYYNHTTSTLETNSFRVSISLKSELVSTIPQLTLLGKYHGHEWQRLMAKIVWMSFWNYALFNRLTAGTRNLGLTAGTRNLGPNYCQTQCYSGCQINKATNILFGRPLMAWPPMMININMKVLAMRHYFKLKQPYPLVCIQNFVERDEIFKTLQFPPKFLD